MKNKIPLEQAEYIAQKYLSMLAPYCERVEIAGSIRRRKAEVGDIEIVAQPKRVEALFGVSAPIHIADPLGATLIKGGARYRQYALPEGINLDLFIVLPPAQWGVIFAIRTGGAEFSHKLVTPRKHGGYLPSHYTVRNGAVYHTGTDELIPTPEEEDFLSICGVAHIPPHERS
ncbi:hypothetical protein [Bellilinea sp.]|uniref:hypothetical protein n=1 Tax=Bellilinea sp. TaxID=2838785 RepID=UPI002ADE49A6|nr:hypothetical protein [Bellilinea sp.]